MVRQCLIACLCGLVAAGLWFSSASSHAGSGVERTGEQTASFLASPFVAAFDPAPLVPRLPIDLARPVPPPGMCRWERSVLDHAGRPVLDRYGRPVKEYAIGSCLEPPPH